MGILTIVPEEFEALREACGARENVPDTAYYTEDPDQPFLVIRKSKQRGNVPANESAREMLEYFQPEVFMLVGIAAGVAGREGVAPGDIVVPHYLHYWEYRKQEPGGDVMRYAPLEHPSESIRDVYIEAACNDEGWIDEIAVRRPEEGKPQVIRDRGLVAVEKLMANPGHPEQTGLLEEFKEAVAVDMESYGVARAVFTARDRVDYNPRLLVIRGISDLLRPAEGAEDGVRSNQEERERWRPYAAAAAAALAADVARRIIDSPDLRREESP